MTSCYAQTDAGFKTRRIAEGRQNFQGVGFAQQNLSQKLSYEWNVTITKHIPLFPVAFFFSF